MSLSMLKMWISLASMGFMFLAIILIYLSRYKFKGVFKALSGIVAYILMIVSGIMMIFVVLTGPTS